ncbi:hypothetical protein BZA05DRAFT_333269 [Tricharina praecox]|uniref:uncharacterized protein n=1 Tax=Tricharina praecox TaxID=43433 RepID=UPI002220999F|nr:uncharacterized protein BZA05DRAFT_333269 [Tricharina praecox]KAI5855778.1 hypothetical protein BZA05DRAFT_333269 [Tricharina praecox]
MPHSPASPTPPPVGAAVDAAGFPTAVSDFAQDPRVSWSRQDSKWVLETDGGLEYTFDEALRRWVVLLDESLAEQQSAIYAVAGVDESEPAVAPRKRKKEKVYTSNADEQPAEEDDADLPKKKKPRAGAEKKEPRKNTAVYVTNLPLDTGEDEIKEVFSKYGVISEEIDTGKPRIKLYRNEDGTLKGDALVIYFRPESVNLAIQMLDDSPLRIGGAPAETIKVQAADFSYKAQQEAPVKTSKKEKRKIIAKTQKLNNKLADWDDDDPSAIVETTTKWDKLVILKHMFTLKELEDDPSLVLDLKEDVREECERLGDVTNVVLYDMEEDGVVTVKFKDTQGAQACVKLMDGRFFAGQQVKAYIADGNEKFKKHTTKNAETADAEEAERLEKFGKFLEEGAGEE